LNGFVNGSTWMEKARAGLRPADDSKTVARRFYRALLDSLGGRENLSAQELELLDHLKRDKEVLCDMLAARDEILETKPSVRRNIGVLSKIDSYINPISVRIVNNLQRVGLARRAKTIDPLKDYVEATYSSNGKDDG
jgi:hypothetical protein